MPGLGFPRWQVELLKVRNGNPGTFVLEWAGEGFQEVRAVKKVISSTVWSEREGRQIG
jgi:protein ImuA